MTTIPLNKLTPFRGNVRKTGAGEGIDELAASIAAHGLLQSLVVRKAARGKFAVIAGQRRLLALSMLAAGDKIPADLPIPCHVVDGEADATEIGLAENTVRVAMHPADQFEAFRELIDKGASVADIAARFGVSEITVTKRLKPAAWRPPSWTPTAPGTSAWSRCRRSPCRTTTKRRSACFPASPPIAAARMLSGTR